jgi:hypothetical protein
MAPALAQSGKAPKIAYKKAFRNYLRGKSEKLGEVDFKAFRHTSPLTSTWRYFRLNILANTVLSCSLRGIYISRHVLTNESKAEFLFCLDTDISP